MMADRTQRSVDIDHYTYRVSWSREDDEFVATCIEFPSMSWLAPSQIEALDGLERLIAEAVEDMNAAGERVPVPMAEREFSGRFNVRIGGSLHRELSIQAAADGMSLNQLVVRKLAAGT